MANISGVKNLSKRVGFKPGRFRRKVKDVVKDQFNDYCVNTTLHGLKYVGITNLHIIERCFFAISFILVVCLSGYFITNVYMKWVSTPIIISLNPQLSQSKDFPFPAVTICNMNQARESFAKNVARDSIEYPVLTSLCYHTKFNSTFSDNIFGKWSFVKRFIVNASQPCSKLLTACRFSGKSVSCDEIFRSILTDEGLCCTFNSLDARFMFIRNSDDNNFDIVGQEKRPSVLWSPEMAYQGKNFTKTPQRIPGAGSHMGLTLFLNADLNEYFCSSTNSYGFKVLLHNPVETPKISNYGMLLSPGWETRLEFTPIWYHASNSIKDIKPATRQCLFENESTLEFFSIYTKLNCEMECEASITEQECGCRALHMPKLNEDVRICDQRDAVCYERVKYRTEYFGDDSLLCECLPACFEIGYRTEYSSAPLLKRKMYQSETIEFDVENTAVLHVFLQDASFRSFTKTEFIGFTEFLSNTGGLLGLFMGFSVVSVIEIIYFVTMRPYCIRKRNKDLCHRATKLIKKNGLVGIKQQKREINNIDKIKQAWIERKVSKNSKVFPYLE